MCPQECFACYKRKFWPVLCYKTDWATLLHLYYYCYLLLVTNYLAIKLSVTDNFSACRKYLAENRLSFSFCSSLSSTLLLIERTMIYPLYLWVIR